MCDAWRLCWLGRCYHRLRCQVPVAVFLSPDGLTTFLRRRMGADASPQDAAAMFDRLVLQGQLRPWQRGLWELDTGAIQELR